MIVVDRTLFFRIVFIYSIKLNTAVLAPSYSFIKQFAFTYRP